MLPQMMPFMKQCVLAHIGTLSMATKDLGPTKIPTYDKELHNLFMAINNFAATSNTSITGVLNSLLLIHEQLLIHEIQQCRDQDQKVDTSQKYTVN